MSNITFSVIDTQCEAADQSFFPPRIRMITKSTTRIATVLGFSEYQGFESSPPKKYRRLTWDGTSEQTLFDGATQIAGAKYDYFGSSEIDLQGNYINLYVKQLSEMCTAADSLCMGLSATDSNPVVASYNLLGWIGPTGNTMCPGTGIPYADQGDKAVARGQSAIYDSTPLSSGISFINLGQFNGFKKTFQIVSATQAQDISSGTQTDVNVVRVPVACNTILTVNHLVPPLGIFGILNWDHNYTATLDEEYTDADALANAKVIVGNGATAQNIPRTTGFVSTFTSVTYTLALTNLINGTSYIVSVDLWDSGTGLTTTVQYNVTATSSTQTITASIPNPAAGHTTTIRNPRIVFA